MHTTTYDVLVIGAGPGGYPAAIRAAQLGLSTIVVDSMINPDDGSAGAWGGVCANHGCIPSKALLSASARFSQLKEGFASMGISVDPQAVHIDFAKMQAHRAGSVKASNMGLTRLFAKYGVKSIAGRAQFEQAAAGGFLVRIDAEQGPLAVQAKHVVVACGTKPKSLPGIEIDEKDIVSHCGALRFAEPPARLGIIGAGVVGLELGSVWNRLGSSVRLFDAADDILPTADAAVRQTVQKELRRQGLEFELGASMCRVQKTPEGIEVEFERQSERKTAVFDKVLVAVGRTPLADSINPQAVGIKLDARGYIEVDQFCRTNVPGIWAVGDVTGGVQLAHYAHEQGVQAALSIATGKSIAWRSPVPSVVYIEPETAWTGESQQSAAQKGIEARIGTCPFTANGRARAQADTRGFVKVVVDARTERIIGVHIVGEGAADMIAEAVSAIAFGATDEDLGMVMHPHPSLSEALATAALAARHEATDL